MKDYLIVGFGLAGLSMVVTLEKNNKTFDVIDNADKNDHRVIGGMYNPIILKRFSPAWRAHEMWLKSIQTYQYFEKKYQEKFIKPFNILRILHSVEEQNNWSVASDKTIMEDYMQLPIDKSSIKGIKAPFGFGKLKNVGRVEGELILKKYKNTLLSESKLQNQNFDYSDLNFLETGKVEYQGKKYSKIIFSEGSHVVNNPFFSYLPMKVSKGEMLLIAVPDLDIKNTIKSKVFMVPLGDNLYIVGSTYNWSDKTINLTISGQKEIETKLKTFLKFPYSVLDYKAGVRPTVSDRRPLIGQHPKYKQFYILNGLGTRGIIYAPALAEILFNFIEKNEPIDLEMNINRFN